MNNQKDNSIDLNELKKQLDARRAVPTVSSDDITEETSTVGGDFAERLKRNTTVETGSVYNATSAKDVVSDSITEVENVDYAESETATYTGPGLVVDNSELVENEQTGPHYGPGITPGTVDGLDAYLKEFDDEIAEAKARAEEIKEQMPEENDTNNENDDESDNMTQDEFHKKYDEAVVIIDKTGFGKVINFTEDEHEKLEKVKKIKVEEIENISLDTIKTKKIKKKDNFDNIIKRVSNITTTNIVLPISGYTAEMRGCSAYELISLIDTNDNALLNAQSKWSLIHNKLENTSIGKMDFNEFLMNTAASDYNTFIYGLLCSTYPDDDTMPLTCDKCGRGFDHKYSVKSLIRAEAMGEKLQDTVMNIVDNSVGEESAKRVHDEALVSFVKRVKLPNSGIIAEIYVQSAYDLINKSIKDLTDNTDEKYTQTAVLSTLINKFYIPDPEEEGTYFEIDSGLEISKTIYTLNEVDVLVIRKLGEDLLNDMSISYGLMDVKCPHCGAYKPFIEMELETILFYRYRQALNTVID